jgi:hypothetical protein
LACVLDSFLSFRLFFEQIACLFPWIPVRRVFLYAFLWPSANRGVQLHVFSRTFLLQAFQIMRFCVLFAPAWAKSHAFFAGIASRRARETCIFTGQSDTGKSPSMRFYGVLAISLNLDPIKTYVYFRKKAFGGSSPGVNCVKYAYKRVSAKW